MNARSFLLAVSSGLICGLLFKWLAAGSSIDAGNPAGRRGPDLLETQQKTTALPGSEADREWELRLSPYLSNPMIPAAKSASTGLRAQTDGVLRLLRQPVGETAIRDGIAALNSDEAVRYHEYIAAIFERWAHDAPEIALAAAENLREPRQRVALVWKVFQAKAGEPDILTKAMAQPPGAARSAAFAALAETVPQERAAELLRESMKDRSPDLSIDSGASFQHDLFRSLQAHDSGLPLRLALETQDPVWRAALLKAACDQSGGPSADQLPELLRDPRNVAGLKDEIGANAIFHPDEGMKKLTMLPDNDRREILRNIVGFSIEFLTSAGQREMMPKESRSLAFASLLADTEKREGPEGVRTLLSDSALARGTQGLDETARWLTSRQDAAGLEDLTRRAAVAEPFTTARWLAGMSQSAERDRAVAVFAETHAAVDPESATVWAGSISDPALRSAIMETVKKSVR